MIIFDRATIAFINQMLRDEESEKVVDVEYEDLSDELENDSDKYLHGHWLFNE